ncbi:MAG: LTA synthase family protein [Clostridia bacterium]|nr:LTA synthase family protein [Clostridia bacterium]
MISRGTERKKISEVLPFTIKLSKNKNRYIICSAAAALASLLCFYITHSLVITAFFPAIMLFTSLPEISFESMKHKWIITLLFGVISGIAGFICSTDKNTLMNLSSMKYEYIFFNILCFIGVFALLYALFPNEKFASVTAVSLSTLIFVANGYVVAFRGTSLKINDIFSVGTALDVAGGYNFKISNSMLYSVLLAVSFSLFVIFGVKGLKRLDKKRFAARGISVFACLVFILSSLHYSKGLPNVEYRNMGVEKYGLALNMLNNLSNSMSYKAPKGYSEFDISEFEDKYIASDKADVKPHIIAIMSESFSDLRIYNGSLSTSDYVMPFYDSLKENTVKGFALASVYGGSTSSSEYEFLTGNTTAFLPSGVSAYQNYVSENTYSLASLLDSYGYTSIAMHPENSTNWMRGKAWQNLGFEKSYFIEDYAKKDLIRSMVSDMEFTDKLIEVFEESSDDGPLFLFGITMQNHGGYTWGNYEATIKLEGYNGSYPQAEQYLSLIRTSDDALKKLVNYLEASDEKTVLLFFGDHQPAIEEAFLRELNGSAFDTLEEMQKQYTVPFFIWANYDIPEADVPLTSLNYLSNYLLNTAGLDAPYNAFLRELEKDIPAMNLLGLYYSETRSFIRYDDPRAEKMQRLCDYRLLQYHSIHEKAKRSKLLFP